MMETGKTISFNPTKSSAQFFADGRLCQILPPILDRYRKFIFLGIAITYLLGFNGQWHLGPDSGLYLILARNLALGRGYTYGGARHELVYPGLPVTLSGLYRIFPGHFIFAADVLIILCALGALALIYRLILLAYDRPTAVAITMGVAFTAEFYRYSFEILTDMPFLTGVLAVLAGHEAIFGCRPVGVVRKVRWWDWGLLILGLVIAITTRPTMIGLLASWIVALFYSAVVRRNWKSAGAALGFCLVSIALFLMFDPRHLAGYGLYEQNAFNHLRQFGEFRAVMVTNAWDLFWSNAVKATFAMRLGVWWVNILFSSIVLSAGIALIRKRLFWGLWVIATIATLILMVSDDRYILQILPLLVLGWWNLLKSINLRLPRRWGNGIFAILLFMGISLNFVQVIGVIIQQRSRSFLAVYQEGRYQQFAELAREIPRVAARDDIILCPIKLARIMSFLCDRMFYEQNEMIPSVKGHLWVVLDSTDQEYSRWLADQGVHAQSAPALEIHGLRGHPAIQLVPATIGYSFSNTPSTR